MRQRGGRTLDQERLTTRGPGRHQNEDQRGPDGTDASTLHRSSPLSSRRVLRLNAVSFFERLSADKNHPLLDAVAGQLVTLPADKVLTCKLTR